MNSKTICDGCFRKAGCKQKKDKREGCLADYRRGIWITRMVDVSTICNGCDRGDTGGCTKKKKRREVCLREYQATCPEEG